MAATCNLACADYVNYVLEREGDVAAVIAETVRNVPVIPPPDYWKRIRAACDRHGALLILDEIPIGLGRTGKFFAFEHFGVVPDIVVLGKGLGGGVFPLAGILARERLNVAAERSLGHYTHEKNPAACAAGLATLEVIDEDDLVRRAAEIGAKTLADLRQRLAGHPLVREVRGLGLLTRRRSGAPGQQWPRRRGAHNVRGAASRAELQGLERQRADLRPAAERRRGGIGPGLGHPSGGFG